MTNIGKELYIQSYENILALVEDTLFMEDSFKRYKTQDTKTTIEELLRAVGRVCLKT